MRRALKELELAKLVSFTVHEIKIAKETLCEGDSDSLLTIQGRSPFRPIPLARAVLRHLARERAWTLSKVMLAYAIRGLALSRKGGVIKNRGTVKATWIADHFGMSLRSVRYARKRLYGLGWIEPDTGSFQRKLNRDGAYFVIAVSWSPKSSTQKTTRDLSFAPRPPKNTPTFAPPREDRKTSYEVKNQKTPESGTAGFFKGEASNRKTARGGTPSIRRILLEDLSRFDRLHELYRQAVQASWLPHSEANALNFVAAAVRAREAEGDSPRIFVSLVKRQLWQNITQAQEERARKAMMRFREQKPEWFRPALSLR